VGASEARPARTLLRVPLPPRTGPVAALVGATLFWAGNYVLGAVAVREMTPSP
jgi:hypothetical protein